MAMADKGKVVFTDTYEDAITDGYSGYNNLNGVTNDVRIKTGQS